MKNFWWWTEELFKTCRVLFLKYIWEISASSWFYYKNLSQCTVTWTSKWNEQSLRYDANCSSLNPQKYHYLSTQSMNTLVHLSLIGMTLSVQIELLKDHGTSVHSFTAQTKQNNSQVLIQQFGLLNQHLGEVKDATVLNWVAVLGDSHIANMYLWMFYNILCTLWIHCVATAVERCVSSAVQLLHVVQSHISVLLRWHEWTSVS